MGSPISAKGGKVEIAGVEVEDVFSVSATRTNDGKEYRSSSTAGETKRLAGHNDGGVRVEFYNDEGTFSVPFVEGTIYAIEGFSDDSHSISGSYLCTSAEHNVAIGDGAIMGCAVQLDQDGAPTART